jgi:hypothetical protein
MYIHRYIHMYIGADFARAQKLTDYLLRKLNANSIISIQ